MASGITYPSSWTDIANLALTRLGSAKINNLIQPDNENASYCSMLIGQAVDDVYIEHSWKGATKRIQLAQLIETPAFGFSYFYQMPTDWVRNPDQEKEGERSNIDTDGQDYSIEGDRLLTDATEVFMAYIARPDDVSKIRPYLRSAIALRLAFLLTTPLTSSESLASRVAAEYSAAINSAIANDNKVREERTQEKEMGVIWFDELR